MKKIYLVILIILLIVSGCKKNDKPELSGTVTLDNKLYGTTTYYALGFTFSTAKTSSTLNVPPPDITIDAFSINVSGHDSLVLFFYTNNFLPSFFCYASYPDATAATQAYKNLTSFSPPQWTDLGDNVNANQIWLFKTSNDTYAKLRVVSTVRGPGPIKPVAECTFEWVYQPDGSLTFPGK
jgi:hypothetical protein